MSVDTTPEARSDRGRRRAGGRAGNERRAGAAAIRQSPWTVPQYSDNPVEPLDREGVERIHDGAMRVLEEIGIDFLNEEAKPVLREAGADVDPNSNRVRMDRAFVMEKVRLAPSSFEIVPRNPERRIVIGGKHSVNVNVSSPPNVAYLERGRRVSDCVSFLYIQYRLE